VALGVLKLYTIGESTELHRLVADLQHQCSGAPERLHQIVVQDLSQQPRLQENQSILPVARILPALPPPVRQLLSQVDSTAARLVGVSLTTPPIALKSGGGNGVTTAAPDDRSLEPRLDPQAQLRLLQTCVSRLNDIVLITEAEPIEEPGPRIVFVNDAFEKHTGFASAEVLGLTPRILQGPATSRQALERIRAALLRWQPVREEVLNYARDGREIWLELDIVPVADDSGWYTHWVAIERDITERKAIEEDRRRTAEELARYREHLEELVSERTAQLAEAQVHAEAANEAKSLFLANMSHEIRTPMNGVLGMADVLAQTGLTEQQSEVVRTMRESGRALLRIIDDILDFSKIEAGRIEINLEPASIEDIVEGLCDSLVSVASRQSVDLHLFVAPQIPDRVLTDPLRLRQVLYNLVGNAIKFSAGNGTRRGRVLVRVHVIRESPLRLAFIIVDNGIGIAPEAIPALFEPFKQADAATTRRYGGTGLGLSIAKRLITLMDGTITVASAPGDGSIFTVELPLAVPLEQPVRMPSSIAGLSCIVLEGKGLEASDLSTYLEYAGATVHRVRNSAEAVQIARTVPGTVVGIRSAGSATLRRVKASHEAPNLQHLVITRGRRRRPRLQSPGVIALDGSALRREVLLRAVAQAAGRLPLEEDLERAEREELKTHAASTPPDAPCILVVEDDEINQHVIVRQLELLGCRAALARDGKEALALWRNGSYDLVLTDLHMPGMDGYDVAAVIRREEAERHEAGLASKGPIPIVALTANALRDEAQRARRAGMNDYLTKPVQLELLREAVWRWTHKPHASA
jgi:PAS domain S-box-containing protein